MQKENKLSTTFAPEEFQIVKLEGSDATVRSMETGRIFHRNVSHLKRLSGSIAEGSSEKPTDWNEHQTTEHLADPVQESIKKQLEAKDADTNKTKDRPARLIRKPAYLDEYQLNTVGDFQV